MLQGIERFAGGFERVLLYLGVYGDRSGDFQEVAAVLARVVGDAANDPFVIEELIIEGWDHTHVDAAQGQSSSSLQRAKGRGHEFAGGREDDAAVQFGGWFLAGGACPHRAQFAGQLAMAGIPGHGVYFHAPVVRHLDGHVRRGAEAVKSQAPSARDAREPQGAESDDPGAEKRSRVQVGEAFRKPIDEVFGRQGVFGVAAVYCIAGEGRVFTEILLAGPAVFADAAGTVQPRNSDAVADAQKAGLAADRFDNPHDLMARDHGRFTRRQLALDDVQVGAADTAGGDADEHLIALGRGAREFLKYKRPALDRRGRRQQASQHEHSILRLFMGRFAWVLVFLAVTFASGRYAPAAEQDADRVVEQAREAFRSGRFGECVRMLEGRPETAHSPEALNMLGGSLAKLGRADAAERALRLAMDRFPEHLAAYYNLAQFFLERKKPEQAIPILTDGLRVFPRSDRLLRTLGTSYQQSGHFKDAQTTFRKWAAISPASDEPYAMLGDSYLEAGEYTEALESLAQAERRNARNPRVEYLLGLAHSYLGQVGESQACLHRVLELDPGFCLAYYQLAKGELDRREDTKAVDLLRAATACDPKLAQAHYQLSRLYARRGESKLADHEMQLFLQFRLSPTAGQMAAPGSKP